MYWQYFYNHYPSHGILRAPSPFAPPNVQQFKLSAQNFITPAQELQIFLNAVAYQEGYAKKLMDAAQSSKMDVVKELIQSLGIHSLFMVKYNPSGITVTFQPPNKEACFYVSASLCW